MKIPTALAIIPGLMAMLPACAAFAPAVPDAGPPVAADPAETLLTEAALRAERTFVALARARSTEDPLTEALDGATDSRVPGSSSPFNWPSISGHGS